MGDIWRAQSKSRPAARHAPMAFPLRITASLCLTGPFDIASIKTNFGSGVTKCVILPGHSGERERKATAEKSEKISIPGSGKIGRGLDGFLKSTGDLGVLSRLNNNNRIGTVPDVGRGGMFGGMVAAREKAAACHLADSKLHPGRRKSDAVRYEAMGEFHGT